MSEVRVVDLKELGVNKEVFDKIYSMGEQDGRSDKFQEITSEYMLLTEKQVEEIRTDERIKVIDEYKEILIQELSLRFDGAELEYICRLVYKAEDKLKGE